MQGWRWHKELRRRRRDNRLGWALVLLLLLILVASVVQGMRALAVG